WSGPRPAPPAVATGRPPAAARPATGTGSRVYRGPRSGRRSWGSPARAALRGRTRPAEWWAETGTGARWPDGRTRLAGRRRPARRARAAATGSSAPRRSPPGGPDPSPASAAPARRSRDRARRSPVGRSGSSRVDLAGVTLGGALGGLGGRVVAEVGAQPALDLGDRHPLAGVVVDDLVAPELADREIAGGRVGEVEAAHAGAGPHRERLGQLDAGRALHVQQLPERPLLGVRRTIQITGRWADAAVLLANELLVAQVFATPVAPLFSHPLVKVLGEGLGQPVGQRLGHDGVVVVVRGAEAVAQLAQPDAGGHGKATDVVGQAGLLGGHEVGQAARRLTVLLGRLLPQEVEAGHPLAVRTVKLDVVAHGVGAEEPVDAAGADQPLFDHAIEQRVPLGEDLAGLLAVLLVLEDAREDALELPGVEERRPVDERPQRLQRHVLQHPRPQEGRRRKIVGPPLDGRAVGARRLQRDQLGARRAVDAAQLLVVGPVLGHEGRLVLRAQQAGGDRNGAAGVQHVHHRLAVSGRDLDRRVGAAGGGPADQQRQLEPLALHLARHVRHLVQRRRDQARQADEVGLLGLGPLEDLLARDHDAHVDDLVVVAGQHDTHDVLADVVDVALDGGQHDLPLRAH